MDKITMNNGIDWTNQEQLLNEYDSMFCKMLFYCLNDSIRIT